MRKISRHAATIVVVSILVLINLVALNWSQRFFRNSEVDAFLRYGDVMPRLGGPDYSGSRDLSVGNSDLNLVVYLSGPYLNGRSISLVKSGELLQREHGADGLRFTLITAGPLNEVQELLRDNLITYRVVNDSDGALAERLGLKDGESGTFLFDRDDSCRFSARQQASFGDLRRLLANEGLPTAGSEQADSTRLMKGKPLPSWPLVEARTLKRTNVGEVGVGSPRLWVFFPADCFSCGAPEMHRYMAEFNYWRKSDTGDAAPVLVFDSAFTREAVVKTLGYAKIESPAYLSDAELSPLARIATAKGKSLSRLVLIRTDASGAVSSMNMIQPPNSPPPDAETSGTGEEVSAPQGPPYRKMFQGLAVDIYDVDSYKNLYVVSDRTRNSILVINERSEIQKEISGIGSAPGKLFRPGYLDVADDGIVYVQDGGNERVQSFDLEGRYLGGFATTQYVGFAAGSGGEVYMGQPEKGRLVTVYSRDGKRLRSFGALKKLSEVYGKELAEKDEAWRNAINRVKLSVQSDGSILVSFMLAPIIQKYTQQGELVFERRLEGPEINRLTEMVLDGSAGSHLTMSVDGFAERVMSLEALALPGGDINVILTDGSVYVADAEGNRVRVIHPRADGEFTPEMTGVSPAGEPVVVGLTLRDCYALPRQAG